MKDRWWALVVLGVFGVVFGGSGLMGFYPTPGDLYLVVIGLALIALGAVRGWLGRKV